MYKQKPGYQPWNEEEFLSDVYVRGMTPVQRWMYRTLLQASFFHSTRPYLPKEEAILWVLAGCESLEQWRANSGPVLARFETTENGLIGNKRVVEDWGKLLDKREKMAELGRKSASVKRTFNGSQPVVNEELTSKSKRESNSQSQSEVETEESTPSLSLDQFADRWN